jgi:hypothetical protein
MSADARRGESPRRLAVRVRHRAFSPVATMNVLVDGPRVLLGGRTLIDEGTHSQTSVTPPAGCAPVAIGGPWIAATCGIASHTPPFLPQPELYGGVLPAASSCQRHE